MKPQLSKNLIANKEELKYIAKSDDLDALKLFLTHFDINLRNDKGQNIVQVMMDSYNFYIPLKCCQYLFSLKEMKPFILELDSHGNNIIYNLFFQDCYNYDLMKLALEAGNDINQVKQTTKENLLHYLVLQHHNDMFDLAMKYGANLNQIADQNITTLHCIARFGKTQYICQKVIELIDSNLLGLKDESNLTAMDYIKKNLKDNSINQELEQFKYELLHSRLEQINLEKNLINLSKLRDKQIKL